MLVLSRRNTEQIVIGDTIVVTVLSVKGNHVRLGIAAPNNVPVWRGELAARMKSGREYPSLADASSFRLRQVGELLSAT
jgi:carbon storage regulator